MAFSFKNLFGKSKTIDPVAEAHKLSQGIHSFLDTIVSNLTTANSHLDAAVADSEHAINWAKDTIDFQGGRIQDAKSAQAKNLAVVQAVGALTGTP